MNNRTAVFERAMHRMEIAKHQAMVEERNEELLNMVLQKMEDNGTSFFLDPLLNILVIADLKHCQTIH